MDEVWQQKYREWIEKYKDTIVDFGSRHRPELHYWLMQQIGMNAVDYLEFGVRGGQSFEWWTTWNGHEKSRFYGFDSFHGLPEAWDGSNSQHEIGALTTHGLVPNMVDSRVRFYAGYYDKTLEHFFNAYKSRPCVMVCHIDCDLYSSTMEVLQQINKFFKPGDYLIMDDAGTGEEFQAFDEMYVDGDPVAVSGSAVVVKIGDEEDE